MEAPRPIGAPVERGPEEWEEWEDAGSLELWELAEDERRDETRPARKRLVLDPDHNSQIWSDSRKGRQWRSSSRKRTDGAAAHLERLTAMPIDEIRMDAGKRPTSKTRQDRQRIDRALALLLGIFTRDALGDAIGIAGKNVEARAKRAGWAKVGRQCCRVTYERATIVRSLTDRERDALVRDGRRRQEENARAYERWVQSQEP